MAATLAAALVAAGALLLVSQASAVSGTLNIGSATLTPGGQATIDIRSNVPAPGLGAWTLDLSYDSSKVSIVSCAPAPAHSECNTGYGANTVRLVGATGPGLIGDQSLATITFHSLAASGTACSPVSLNVTPTLFVDATTGGPLPVTVTVTNGSLQCPAAPAATPTATPLPQLVVSGAGSGADGSSSGWLIAMAGVGVALLAAYGALRLRTR